MGIAVQEKMLGELTPVSPLDGLIKFIVPDKRAKTFRVIGKLLIPVELEAFKVRLKLPETAAVFVIVRVELYGGA